MYESTSPKRKKKDELNEKVQAAKQVIKPGTDGFVAIPVVRQDEILKEFFPGLPEGTWICGGFARFLCSPNEEPAAASDIDIFSKDQETFQSLIKYLREDWSSEYIIHTDNFVMCRVWLSNEDERIIQAVRPEVASGSPAEVIKTFDFTVNRVAILSTTEALADPDFIEDEIRMRLRVKHIRCPISIVSLRAPKYVRKGYYLPLFDAVRLFYDWDERSPEFKTKLGELVEKEGDLKPEERKELYRLLAFVD